MASPTCSYLQQFINLPIGGGEVAARRVDADYINAFGTDLARSTSDRLSSGDKAVDAGSAPGRCSISLRSDQGAVGIIKNGDWYKVTELATGSVWTGTAQADDIIAFSTAGGGGDGALMEGAAPPFYDAAAFIDDLRIEIKHQLNSKVQVQQVNTTDGDAGALQTDNLLRPGGAVLETDMAANEVSYAVGHTLATGAHNAGVIGEVQFDDAAFENFNYANLLANGGAEVGYAASGDPGAVIGDNPPFYWSAVLGREPTNNLYISTAQVYEGRHSCYAGYGAANQAIDLDFDPLEFDVTQHRGKDIALTVAVRATVADSITVGFNGAVGGEDVSAAGGAAGAWTIMTHIMTINAGETGLTVRLVNTFAGGNVTYFDAAITVLGSKPVAFKRSRWEDGALEARHISVFNLALNHLFSYWTNGVAADPDCWESLGTCVTIQNAVNFARGDFSADVTLPDNAGTFQHILGYSPGNKLAEALQSRYITAKFKVLWIAGAKNLHVTLRSNVGGNSITEIIDLPSCQPNFVPCAVIALEVDAAATDIYLEFQNLDAGAGQIDFYLDDVQITPTPWPCPPVIPNFFEIEIETWGYQGTCDASLAAVDLFRADVGSWATNLGHQLGYFGVPLRAYAEADAGPAAAATTFTLLVNGAAVDTVVITNPATAGMSHTVGPGVWNRILPTDFIRVEASVGSTAVDDPVVRWVILKCAANTSEV